MQESGAMKTKKVQAAVFYITNKSRSLAGRIKKFYPEAQVFRYKSEIIKQEWDNKRLLIFIMAAGIAVRSISQLIKNKKTDPAVLVIDEEGRYVISLLSGHIGGANAHALEIADFLKAQAVITTASDINKLTSIDMWAHNNNLIIQNEIIIPSVSTKLLNNGQLKVYDETDMILPDEFVRVQLPRNVDILITNKLNLYKKGSETSHPGQLILRPKNIVIGIGCNSGTTSQEIESFVRDVMGNSNLSFSSISCLATIDIKASEKGIVEFSEKHGFNINTYSPEEINKVKGIEKSKAVFEATGAYAVAEPTALLASSYGRLLVPKQARGNVTVAAAEIRRIDLAESSEELPESSVLSVKVHRKGKIYIVGTGPGSIKHITPAAVDAIISSDFIVGYDTYLELIHELIAGKNIISTGMTQEIDRCKKAIELANDGWTVSVISGGDPGIYAMAGLVFELLISLKANSNLPDVSIPDVEVVPGISALNAAASRLGAPLMHDFACISLSDRLTPWDIIVRRLDAAASSDFVMVLYNPKSKGRTEHINIAASIIRKYRHPDTPVGIVRQAMRERETVVITNVHEFLSYDIDMQTTIIIGNSRTFARNGWIITPRGYNVPALKEQ
jgi:cobalt-precorrin 5A hydrolase/precorrin-3B C17-methyltransferase